MSLFKKPNELRFNRTVRVLIYGEPGIGKSTLALSAPSPVLLDFDGGVHRVNGAHIVPTLQVENYEQVIEALKEDLSDYQTIVIDTAGKMLDYMSAYIIKKNPKAASYDGSLTLKGFGARKQLFIDFLNNVSSLGKHVVFVAHGREEKKGEDRYVRPEIGGSSANDLIKELDLVGYMKAIGKERTIFWNPQEEFYAKNSCNLPDASKVPMIIDADGNITGKNEFLTLVVGHRDNYMSSQEEQRKSYDNLISAIGEEINAIDSVEKANQVRKNILEVTHIWDSKVKAGLMLNEKCNSLNIKYNKLKEMYEAV